MSTLNWSQAVSLKMMILWSLIHALKDLFLSWQICVPVEDAEVMMSHLCLNRPRAPIETLDEIMQRIVQVPGAPVEANELACSDETGYGWIES